MNEIPSPSNLIWQQIETLVILLERPRLINQLLAITAVFVLSWVARWAINRLRARLRRRASGPGGRWLPQPLRIIIDQILFSILFILGLVAAVPAFEGLGLPARLIEGAIPFAFLILGYEILVGILYAYGSRAAVRPYHYRVLLPLLIWFVFSRIVDNFIDLSLLGQIQVTSFGEDSLTVGQIFYAALILYISIVASWIVQDVLTRILLQRTSDSARTHSIATVMGYLIISIGIFTAARSFGLSAASLAFIGGGLSVGIGFGLQQIVANFLSGIVLLFEQSLRPGDVIEVNGILGRVERLSIRSAVVRTNDNIDIVVPNQQFLTSNVTTYTREDSLVRINLDLGVSYESDPQLVRDILLHTARQHGKVEKDPAPYVFFNGFGESSLDFRLSFWIRQPRELFKIRSDLYFMIWKALETAGIEIPFPQRDLHLRSGWDSSGVDRGQVPAE